jgi:pimeloyl-ACP methyl ester carboxylesterase
MKRITLVVFLAIVGLGGVVIRYSGGRTVKSTGENRTTTSRDGTTIAFTRRGSGPPLIIVDGAFCYRENGPATELASLLAQHFTVFTYDRRGRGESGDTKPYTVESEIEDFRALASEAGTSPFVLGISSGGALTLQAVASGVDVKEIALYEPPYLAGGNGPRSFEDVKNRLQSLVSVGDRAGAVRFFMTDVYGAPRAFVFAMPFLMPNAWKRNKLVVHTTPYDLTILGDRSVLNERRSSISVPALVIGGEKSPKELRDAVATVANALPNARSRFLPARTTTFPVQSWFLSCSSSSERARLPLHRRSRQCRNRVG